jgi:hypothetical protein
MSETTRINGKHMGAQVTEHTHYVKDIIMHPAAQVAGPPATLLASWGTVLQTSATVVTIIFVGLQIYLAVERRWFRKGEQRRKGE